MLEGEKEIIKPDMTDRGFEPTQIAIFGIRLIIRGKFLAFGSRGASLEIWTFRHYYPIWTKAICQHKLNTMPVGPSLEPSLSALGEGVNPKHQLPGYGCPLPVRG